MTMKSYSAEFLRAFGERDLEEFICRGLPTGDLRKYTVKG